MRGKKIEFEMWSDGKGRKEGEGVKYYQSAKKFFVNMLARSLDGFWNVRYMILGYEDWHFYS